MRNHGKSFSRKKALHGLGIFCAAAALAGCSAIPPRLKDISTKNGGIYANAPIFEFDKPSEPAKDVTPFATRDYGFGVDTVREGDGRCFVAHNRRESPVSVMIRITAEENLASDQEFPFATVVPPNSDTCIARVYPLDKDKKDYRYRSSESWMLGDFTARHNAREGYRVPWAKGESHAVTQSPDGPITTHSEPANRNAIDFAMPSGTPVHAARRGTVIGIEQSFKVGGQDRVLVDKANYVDVLHDDGTIATYAHLAEKSVVVRMGQRVAAGDMLALSGSTGYSSGPHLHFAVWTLEKTDKGFERISLPVEFCFDNEPRCFPLTYHMTVSTDGVTDTIGGAKKGSADQTGSVERPGKTSAENPGSSLVLDLVAVKGGCFQSGPNLLKKTCVNDFSIGRYEVTQRQWQQIMGSNPAYYKQCGPDCPVENVSWDDVQKFITELNKRTGKNYRLPTEAEWEFAASGRGKNDKYAGSDKVDAVAWYKGNSNNRTHPVGQKQPNGLGLFDMSGNVWEWVADRWPGQKRPGTKSQSIPQDPPAGSFRVMRGGGWHTSKDAMLTNLQGLYSEPTTRSREIGFRLAQ
jgi:formylglycine-generating enzyme required for sulfatase activity